MPVKTSVAQRKEMYRFHQGGKSYPEIAAFYGLSRGCVRYWCRRQRDGQGVKTVYPSQGMLQGFDAKVRYCILRLRLEHPRWGPNRILARLGKRSSLRGLKLPSEASIGRYVHQWSRFRRRKKPKEEKPQRPIQATRVHQRWQLDFKLLIEIAEEQYVHMATLRDPVGEVCIGAQVFPGQDAQGNLRRVSMEEARTALRTSFTRWGTLPEEIQTDGDTVLVARRGHFPNIFTLWLCGLGIDHVVGRPGRPTDQAEVERCHRTLNEYVIIGNEHLQPSPLQIVLDQAVHELAFELISWAEGCQGRPPVDAHPELLQAPRPYLLEHELVLFDLARVDQYLASLSWQRKVSKNGQVRLGKGRRYSVGAKYGGQEVLAYFDPTDRHFFFVLEDDPDQEINRLPAFGLEIEDLTGFGSSPLGPGPQQLPLPWEFYFEVNVNEQIEV